MIVSIAGWDWQLGHRDGVLHDGLGTLWVIARTEDFEVWPAGVTSSRLGEPGRIGVVDRVVQLVDPTPVSEDGVGGWR